MAVALSMAHEAGGKLVRYVGGYWAPENSPLRSHDGHPVDYVGTSTIEALVKRGELTYSDWKEGRGGKFPIAVVLKALENGNG